MESINFVLFLSGFLWGVVAGIILITLGGLAYARHQKKQLEKDEGK